MFYLAPTDLQPISIPAPPAAPATPVAPIDSQSLLCRLRVTHQNTDLFSPRPLPMRPINSDDESDSANATFHSLDPSDL